VVVYTSPLFLCTYIKNNKILWTQNLCCRGSVVQKVAAESGGPWTSIIRGNRIKYISSIQLAWAFTPFPSSCAESFWL